VNETVITAVSHPKVIARGTSALFFGLRSRLPSFRRAAAGERPALPDVAVPCSKARPALHEGGRVSPMLVISDQGVTPVDPHKASRTADGRGPRRDAKVAAAGVPPDRVTGVDPRTEECWW
jgi:hypothetical protein